jgi:hypothetical protein
MDLSVRGFGRLAILRIGALGGAAFFSSHRDRCIGLVGGDTQCLGETGFLAIFGLSVTTVIVILVAAAPACSREFSSCNVAMKCDNILEGMLVL